MNKNKTLIIKISLTIGLITMAVIWRIINHDNNFAPNLELITLATVLASVIVGMRASIIVPITSMIISDLIIGNSSIFIFTWGAFGLIGLGAILLRKLNNRPKKQILYSVGFVVISSFTFFLITNFGVWAQGWYPPTFAGLMTSYELAIPFYRTMLIGNLILVPVAVLVFQTVRSKIESKNLVINPSIS